MLFSLFCLAECDVIEIPGNSIPNDFHYDFMFPRLNSSTNIRLDFAAKGQESAMLALSEMPNEDEFYSIGTFSINCCLSFIVSTVPPLNIILILSCAMFLPYVFVLWILAYSLCPKTLANLGLGGTTGPLHSLDRSYGSCPHIFGILVQDSRHIQRQIEQKQPCCTNLCVFRCLSAEVFLYLSKKLLLSRKLCYNFGGSRFSHSFIVSTALHCSLTTKFCL